MKLFILIRREPDEAHEDFMRWWSETHATLAERMPGLLSYVLHEVTSGFERDVDWDGIAELEFASEDDARRGFASAEGKAVMADAAVRRGARLMLLTRVLRVVVAPTGEQSSPSG